MVRQLTSRYQNNVVLRPCSGSQTSDRDLQVRLVSRLLKETGGSLTGDDTETQANIGEEEHTKLVGDLLMFLFLQFETDIFSR